MKDLQRDQGICRGRPPWFGCGCFQARFRRWRQLEQGFGRRHGVGDSEKVLKFDWQAGEANSFHSPRPFIFPKGHVCLDDYQIVFTHRRFWMKASCKITCHDLFVMLIRGCMTITSVDRHEHSFGSFRWFPASTCETFAHCRTRSVHAAAARPGARLGQGAQKRNHHH